MEKTPETGTRVFVLSAYDLCDGDVVYLAQKDMQNGTQNDTWARQLPDARIFLDEKTAAPALERAHAQQNEVIGAYLMNAAIAPDGTARPVHFREAFRATGPSDRFIGKQADTPSTEPAHVRL